MKSDKEESGQATPVSSKKPRLEDFYDESDPRGCSTSEYNNYLEALEEWKKRNSD